MRGSCIQAIAYCCKEDSRDGEFYEAGERPSNSNQGKRTDLIEFARDAKVMGLRPLAEKHPNTFVAHYKGAVFMRGLFSIPRNFKTKVFWFFGATGTGKSRLAFEMCKSETSLPYVKMGDNKWWDGYDGHDDVIIDDYRPGLCPFNTLLRLFDRYPLLVEQKGSTTNFCAKRIIVTTNFCPLRHWAKRCDEDLLQLMRRIDVLRCFTVGEEFEYDEAYDIKKWTEETLPTINREKEEIFFK